jgi:hypothetical protein
VAGSSCYPTIQAAQTAAISAGGSVLIPAAYAGNDTVPTQSYSIVDLRNNILSSSHFFGCTYAIANAPGGLDCSFEADGAGDLWLAHNTHVNPATTTSMSLIAGSNLSVLVGSTTLFGNGGTAPLIVGRGTPNQETVAWTNWSVVDGTHLSINTAKTHSGTTDIEQLGLTILDSGASIIVIGHTPSQFTANTGADFISVAWVDANGLPFMFTPGHAGGSVFPYNSFLFSQGMPISCFNPGSGNSELNPGNCAFRNYDLSHSWAFNTSTGNNIAKFNDTTSPLTFGSIAPQVEFGAEGTGGAYFFNTPSLGSSYPSGLGIDGTYSSTNTVIRLHAIGVQSGGGYNSSMKFCTTNNIAETCSVGIDMNQNIFNANGTSIPGAVLGNKSANNTGAAYVELVLTGTTGTITGTALTATCDSGTASVTGAVVGHPVAVSSTTGADVGGAFNVRASVTSTGTVTVYVCGTGTPASLAFNVTVF